MDISFTGINNLQVGANAYRKISGYIGPDGLLKHDDKIYRLVKLKFNVSNDASGQDLDKFRQMLKKYNMQDNLNNNSNPQGEVELYMRRWDSADGYDSSSEFNLNGNHIILLDRKQLPLYTYLAEITRKLAGMRHISEDEKGLCKFVNRSVADEAERFIELM